RPVHSAVRPEQHADPVLPQHHRLHGGHRVGTERRDQARLEDAPGGGQRPRAQADHRGRRLLRRRQLRHVRPRPGPALHLRLAEQPHRRDGRRPGRQGVAHRHRGEAGQAGHDARSEDARHAGNRDRAEAGQPVHRPVRHRQPVGRRPHRPARYPQAAGLFARYLRRGRGAATEIQHLRGRAPVSALRLLNIRRRTTTMHFTQEHDELRRTVRNFVDKEINPYVDEWEKDGRFPMRELFKKAGDLGLLGISKPEKFGGMGLDYSYSIVAAEEFGTVHCGGVPLAIGVQTDMCTPALARFGSDELREQFLAPAIAGDMIGCIGVSEVGAGSDVAGLKTTARKDGDDYVINGAKMWITNSPQADFMCLLANTSDDKPHVNKSLIVVPMDSKGISLSPHIEKLGMRSSETAQVFLDEVRVPQRYRIGHEGAGFMMQMLQFQEERLFGAANIIKGLELCVDQTIEYCKQRHTFGQPVIDNQVVHFRMAELQSEIEALRALVYQATEQYVKGRDVTKLASMAKLKAGRLGREVTDSCRQCWGGMGFTWDSPVSRAYRDVRLVSIGGGADEIMLGIICKMMGILPGKKKG